MGEPNRSCLNRLTLNIDSGDMFARNVPKARYAAIGHIDVHRGGCRWVLMDGSRFVRSISHAGCADPRIFEDKVAVAAGDALRILRRNGDGKA